MEINLHPWCKVPPHARRPACSANVPVCSRGTNRHHDESRDAFVVSGLTRLSAAHRDIAPYQSAPGRASCRPRARPCHRHGGGLAKESAGANFRRAKIQSHPKSEPPISTTDKQADASALCQTCGACCAFSREWPRFSTEDDADLDRIPAAFVDAGQGGMRCDGDRCSALVGDVGVAASCAVYAVRPQVCRTCVPGDDECRKARRRFGLAALP
jgi:hypothetical protein